MPLQNRVTPFGDIIATPHRGMFTGNRGIIHDPETKTLLNRRWTSRAWLACVCEFRGRRRRVMGGRSWTELFFLDEATAFAAGHRPCFFCRRDDATRFRAAWERGNGVSNLRANDIDAVLHRERLEGKSKRLHPLPVPVSRFLPRSPGFPLGRCPYPTWKYFYSLSPVWRKRPGEATEIFSAIHRTTVVIHA